MSDTSHLLDTIPSEHPHIGGAERTTPPPVPSPGDGWKPIESAPYAETGQSVLTYQPRNSATARIEIRLSDGGYWRWSVKQHREGNGDWGIPTHWMPLPPPPPPHGETMRWRRSIDCGASTTTRWRNGGAP